jgi:hypothetical protein
VLVIIKGVAGVVLALVAWAAFYIILILAGAV